MFARVIKYSNRGMALALGKLDCKGLGLKHGDIVELPVIKISKGDDRIHGEKSS